MADIKSPEERSRNMSRIKSKGTKPEEYIRKLLFSRGFRYRKNVRDIPGCPDAWLAKYNTALFVHGCFWHRHNGCKLAYMPKSHVDFWETKFIRNVERDKIVMANLKKEHIRCLIIWECTVKNMLKSNEKRDNVLNTIIEFLTSGVDSAEL